MPPKSNTVERKNILAELPLDNYRVEVNVLTNLVENHLLANPTLSGFFVVEGREILGVIPRQKFFEIMSREYARDIYAKRPIKLFLNNYDYQSLKIDISTEINEAVQKALTRPPKQIYSPIVVTENGNEVGMLELSSLILAQAQMFSSINETLVSQEKDLRRYAQKIEREKEKVKEYSQQLEEQQVNLKTSNSLLKTQTQKLELQKEELSKQSKEINLLNQSFNELGSLLSKKGKTTFNSLENSIKSIIEFTSEVAQICDSFREKFKGIDKSTFLIERISKKVDNLSHQVAIISASLPADNSRSSSFNIIADEIAALGNQITEANTTINSMAQQLKPEIKFLLKISEKNKTVVKKLERDSLGTQSALSSLENLIEKGKHD
ncbi:hypothetical protein A5482_004155 [Cyanobacterium sp. IPPAS B-1200]|uniref:hypothetical protein n=1 Tax=Cyanobacterium sp. IPPAS B-1200 TaxID=1562720 RepID=UPI000852544F|nr:hypothetical protein [Cyanobacterium sp. IPPAS B-1200]OEJ79855.1 hypothetical protein A5482_08310 [Cyanobacterium sp. IPPAS B-1200]